MNPSVVFAGYTIPAEDQMHQRIQAVEQDTAGSKNACGRVLQKRPLPDTGQRVLEMCNVHKYDFSLLEGSKIVLVS